MFPHWTGRWAVVTALLAGVCPAVAPAQEAEETEQAKAAIRALIDKFNTAWKEDSGDILVGEVLSDKAFAFAAPPGQSAADSEARVLNKQAYVEAFKKHILNAKLRKHEHQVQSITVLGTLAYEFGTVIDITRDGQEQRADMLNIFAREDVGWRLVFSTAPGFFKKRPSDPAADEKAVGKLARQFLAVFRAKKAVPFEKFLDMLADDVVVILSAGDTRTGKKAVVEFYKDHLAEIREQTRGAVLSWKDMTVKVMGDGALVFGKVIIEARAKTGDESMRREIWETLVFRKDAGAWRLIEEHSTLAQAQPPSKS
jgi:uncharacterized protein (TIGR02246 family)